MRKDVGLVDEAQDGGLGRSNALGYLATSAVVGGAIIVIAHLILGGTSSLVLSAFNVLDGWTYLLGFVLVVLGLLLHAARVPHGKQHAVIAVSCGVLAVLATPIALLYLGIAGIGLETDDDAGALIATFSAALIPVILAFGGGVFSWLTLNRPTRFRFRGMTLIAFVSVALAVACIAFARLTLNSPELG